MITYQCDCCLKTMETRTIEQRKVAETTFRGQDHLSFRFGPRQFVDFVDLCSVCAGALSRAMDDEYKAAEGDIGPRVAATVTQKARELRPA
jgi:hypothetical protein